MSDTLEADTEALEHWVSRRQCWMCRHRFDRPLILPVAHPERGKFHPEYNGEFLFHLYDTHGLSPDLIAMRVMGSVYGWPRRCEVPE